eukprot:355907-Chlamydomonas_euryale.AAC.1
MGPPGPCMRGRWVGHGRKTARTAASGGCAARGRAAHARVARRPLASIPRRCRDDVVEQSKPSWLACSPVTELRPHKPRLACLPQRHPHSQRLSSMSWSCPSNRLHLHVGKVLGLSAPFPLYTAEARAPSHFHNTTCRATPYQGHGN